MAKSAGSLAGARTHYPMIALKHDMHVALANCLGPSDDFVTADA